MSEGDGATCPFCGAAWSEDMLAQLDRFTMPSGCACCGGAPGAHAAAAPLPTEDICCAACGRAIYRGFAAKQESQS
ncbi:hypothetical protein [Sphingomonas sp.]|uniref:hypothetical protein n=1 Tax=Sphingomonas sp. TaxID=28214 RepID=UPI0025E88876|nr:hypothetical protein [Sphingomonas sp.]